MENLNNIESSYKNEEVKKSFNMDYVKKQQENAKKLSQRIDPENEIADKELEEKLNHFPECKNNIDQQSCIVEKEENDFMEYINTEDEEIENEESLKILRDIMDETGISDYKIHIDKEEDGTIIRTYTDNMGDIIFEERIDPDGTHYANKNGKELVYDKFGKYVSNPDKSGWDYKEKKVE